MPTYPTELLISQLATALHAVMNYSAEIAETSINVWPAHNDDDGQVVCGTQLHTKVFVKGFEDIGVYSAELIYDAQLIGGIYDEKESEFSWSGKDYCFFSSNGAHGLRIYDETGAEIDEDGKEDFLYNHFGVKCYESAGEDILEQALCQLSEVEKRQFLRIVLVAHNHVKRKAQLRDNMDFAINVLQHAKDYQY